MLYIGSDPDLTAIHEIFRSGSRLHFFFYRSPLPFFCKHSQRNSISIMPNNRKQNQGKQKLQDQVQRLNNELEELRLEREESKKNVLHFMQEADLARQELQKAYTMIAQLSQQATAAALPVSMEATEEAAKVGKTGGLVASSSEDDELIAMKTTQLLVMLQQVDNPKGVLDQFWDQINSGNNAKDDGAEQQKQKEEKEEEERRRELEQQQQKLKEDQERRRQEVEQQQQQQQEEKIQSLAAQLKEAHDRIYGLEADKQKLMEELTIAKTDQDTARQARDIEHERAETLEKRWQTSESDLEQAETRIQMLERDLESLRQKEWVSKAPASHLVEKTELEAKCKELEQVQAQLSTMEKDRVGLQDRLEHQSGQLKDYREKQCALEEKLSAYKQLENQQQALEQAKIRENHLKTINKTLRDEMRKVSQRNNMEINNEYLKNVIIKFLEKKQTRAQLIPVLSTLLQCSREEQSRLNKLVRNKVSS
ncbi:hypothetical protein BDB00DRAFT_834891 [Zychaea mexicana]|uniref:uncharacterized protein n=1 Tax=Zychaea mexicana TaxID=64656 RepID=UPI0022FDE94D|nr:uncharacterized protein BDB00DRAFT_834891 [Zychaea mexicana]KAI9491025.1 hypothetical protein BDB00DRAFT_834891 [Zychaea mexicana]